ncbi:MAG: hypothetical protein HY651_01785 [Acidobacteria bacterium]|nr:hypothetical protein [Acidobacteriota bacterium]
MSRINKTAMKSLLLSIPMAGLMVPSSGEAQVNRAGGSAGAGVRSGENIVALLKGQGIAVLATPVALENQAAQELRIHWVPSGPASAANASRPGSGERFEIVGKQSDQKLPRQRSAELSSDLLLVVSLDSDNRLMSWALIPDPRLIRAEFPNAAGELRGQVLQRPEVEFLVLVPDHASLAELRFYHPRWTGETFILELAGGSPLTAIAKDSGGASR